jgi:hypothetical protein
LPTSSEFVPAVIESFDELIDDLQQSTRVGLNGCLGAQLAPIFVVTRSSHGMTEAIR